MNIRPTQFAQRPHRVIASFLLLTCLFGFAGGGSFLLKFNDPVPEPTAGLLLCIGAALVLGASRIGREKKVLALCVAAFTLSFVVKTPPAHALTIEWATQIPDSAGFWGHKSNLNTDGEVFFAQATNSTTASLRKFGPDGELLWSTDYQPTILDPLKNVSTRDVGIDSLGNVYFAGSLRYENSSFETENDLMVVRHDEDGNFNWMHPFGTPDHEVANGLAVDDNDNILVVGLTRGNLASSNAGNSDSYIRKIDSNGTALWTTQFGTPESDQSFAIDTDSLGNVFVAGLTAGSLQGASAGGNDYFLAKYSTDGLLQWIKQTGTPASDRARATIADGSGGAYVAGLTDGGLASPNAGETDAFVAYYDAAGVEKWTTQFGTPLNDYIYSIAPDRVGNLYVAGSTRGALSGPSVGGSDAYLAKLDATGSLLWVEQFGSSANDTAHSVSSDGRGGIVVSGVTSGNIFGDTAGSFVVKFNDPVPEPTAGLLLCLGAALFLGACRTGHNKNALALCVTAFTLSIVAKTPPAHALTIEWAKQFSDGPVVGHKSAIADNGEVFFAQRTGDVTTASLRKFSPDGELLWSTDYRPAIPEFLNNVSTWDVSIDSLGNVYFTGGLTYEDSTFDRQTDLFLARHDRNGNFDWIHRSGTPERDELRGIAVDDADNVFAAGTTRGSLAGPNAGESDAFLRKIDSSGAELWTRQFGTPVRDTARGIDTDSLGNVFVTGTTSGNLQGEYQGLADSFLAKYSTDGVLQWTRQLGTPAADIAYATVADGSGGAFLAGYTSGYLASPNSGEADAFVAYYDAEGTERWTTQFGTPLTERIYSMASDGIGNLYVSGSTAGDLSSSSAGGTDAFMAKLDTTGKLIWIEQFGTADLDRAYSVSADGSGGVVVSGYTSGSLFGDAGSSFVVKFNDPVPEPTSGLLVCLGAVVFAAARRARR